MKAYVIFTCFHGVVVRAEVDVGDQLREGQVIQLNGFTLTVTNIIYCRGHREWYLQEPLINFDDGTKPSELTRMELAKRLDADPTFTCYALE